MRPLRVAQVCGATDGAFWLPQICTRLRERGYEVFAIVGAPEGSLAAALREAGIPYVATDQRLLSHNRLLGYLGRVPYLGGVRYLGDALHLLLNAYRMARILRRLRIDVVHTHIISSNLIGRLASFALGLPIRVAMVSSPYHLESALFRAPDLWTQWMDHRLIGGSKRVHDLYAEAGIPPGRRTYAYYGVDPKHFSPRRADPERVRRELGVPPDAPLVGHVAFFYYVTKGLLAPPGVSGRGAKGHEDLVDAARIVLDRRPDARFVLVGNAWGPGGAAHRRDIERRVSEAGIAERVIFAGRRQDIPDVLAAMDVSVQCSLVENLGGTAESLLMERPTVATRVGGMPESVVHEETGLLVPPRAPEELAKAILRLIEDRSLAQRLGQAGRRRMLGGFTIEQTMDRIDGVYRDVARERGVTRPPIGARTEG